MASLDIGLWNWQRLKNDLMEWTDFLHAGANSGKLNVVRMTFGLKKKKMGVAKSASKCSQGNVMKMVDRCEN